MKRLRKYKDPACAKAYSDAWFQPRPLSVIAAQIQQLWPNPGHAKPYLEMMLGLKNMQDRVGLDSAPSVVAYFLTNARTWRGPMARQIKAELYGLYDKNKGEH